MRRVPVASLAIVFLLGLSGPLFAGEPAGQAHGGGHHGPHFPLWSVIPFAGILLSIALFPLLKPKFWHHHYGKVSAFWALLFLVPFAISDFRQALDEVLHVYVLEFIPFIILLWSLYTVSGGVRVKGRLAGTPAVNSGILLLGTVLASWMGTTGAAMLLIRPLLRANAWRKRKTHLVVFFIFLVANIGGSLTPLGDPPLFLGFLKGVHFFWTTTAMFLPMLLCVVVLLVVFYMFDSMMLRKEEARHAPEEEGGEKLGLEGAHNFLFLAGVVAAILYSGYSAHDEAYFDKQAKQHYVEENHHEEKLAAKDAEIAALEEKLGGAGEIPAEERRADLKHLLELRLQKTELNAAAEHHGIKGVKLTGHVTWPKINLLRDGVLVLMGVLSLLTTATATRRKNDFTWFPIVEVGKLFAGIFITIIPAISILKEGPNGALNPVIFAVTGNDGGAVNMMYFWATGILSSFLDNAPTYLVFFNTAGGDATQLMGPGYDTLMAVSAGAVFMGANTYIGNAPNFMVRSIAEEAGVKMPSFFGYMIRWSLPILIPLFVVVSLIWFA